MLAALTGAVIPDIDLIWFYFIDSRAFHHHHYWVHMPFFWLCIGLIVLPLLRLTWRPLFWSAVVFLGAIFLHLLLDSIGGSVGWLWPMNSTLYALVEVPPTRSHWVLSFIFHWTFLLELMIWGAAFWVMLVPAWKASK